MLPLLSSSSLDLPISSPTSSTFPIQLRLRLLSLGSAPRSESPPSPTCLSYNISPLKIRPQSSSSTHPIYSPYSPSSPSPTAVSFKSFDGSNLSSPTSSVYHSMPSTPVYSGSETDPARGEGYIPRSLYTPEELHQAIKSCRIAFVYIHTLTPPPTASQTYTSFLTLSSLFLHPAPNPGTTTTIPPLKPRTTFSPRFNPVLPPQPSPPPPPKQELGFFTVCIEDIKPQDIPLMFGRLGVLPSSVLATGSAVSVQKDGRLWRCVVGGRRIDLEGVLSDVRNT